MADKADVRKLADATLHKWNRIDSLVSNAGQYIQTPIHNSELIDFKRSFDVYFYGSYHAVKEALPHMLEQNSGHFVFINWMRKKELSVMHPMQLQNALVTDLLMFSVKKSNPAEFGLQRFILAE
jgi:NAD(P)-dependent dehydrogenase (short-subunit alcohol dehydrogenase family)